jgi:hypothetical protein
MSCFRVVLLALCVVFSSAGCAAKPSEPRGLVENTKSANLISYNDGGCFTKDRYGKLVPCEEEKEGADAGLLCPTCCKTWGDPGPGPICPDP